jgi:hypothetical protein
MLPDVTASERSSVRDSLERLLAATLLGTLVGAGCAADAHDNSRPPPNYQLICESTDTREASRFFCMRHDTRNGDVRRVAIDQLSVSQGPTVSEASDPGRYELVCHAIRNDRESDLYCVRLDTRTGDLLLVALPKTPTLPEP